MTLPSEKVVNICIWGHRGEGKSSLFATFLCDLATRKEFPHINPIRSAAAMEHFQHFYRLLSQNQLPPPTASPGSFEVVDTRGRTIRIRDMVGGRAGGETLHPEDAQALRESDAVMLVHQWPNESSRPATDAVEAAIAQLPRDRPAVLALTKVEARLPKARAVGFNNGTLSPRDVGLPHSIERLVDVCGRDRTFAVSVYGYHGDRPASVRDELGRVLPCNIAPFCCALPFLAIWRALP